METINKKLECYWSPMAKKAVEAMMTEYGMDRDLAISCLEQIWPEEAIYNIDETVEITSNE